MRGSPLGHVDVVVRDGVRLLHDERSHVGAVKAPLDPRHSEECSAVSKLLRAVVVAPHVLETVGPEEPAHAPQPQADDVSHIALVAGQVVLRVS